MSEAKSDLTDLLYGLIPKPPHFDNWNRTMRGAYRKGIESYLSGKMSADCPYDDKRKPSGKLSWSRAFIICWHDGYKDAEKYSIQQEAL